MFAGQFFPSQYFPQQYYPKLGAGLAPVGRQGHGGFRGAGNYIAYALHLAKKTKQKKDRGGVLEQLSKTKELLDAGWEAEQVYQKNLATAQMYTVLLSEL